MKVYGWCGLLLLSFSAFCLSRKIEPFYTWFYCFAWWSYILAADNLVLWLRGRSLLYSRRSELRAMLPLSVFIWLIFEAFNLSIRNWAYAGVPAEIWLRWAGYVLAFATVLPGVFITTDLVEYILFRRNRRPFASQAEDLTVSNRTIPAPYMVVLGLVFTIAPLLWPKYCFGLVWIGPIFLLDPLLERVGLQSLSLHLAAGDRRRAWSLLAGGFCCGLIWEFWNFWAASRWIYSVPYFGSWKIFEMPLLGFLGFPPFAIECWILYHLSVRILRRCHTRPARLAFWLAVSLFCVSMLRAIDAQTVVRFAFELHRSLPAWPFA